MGETLALSTSPVSSVPRCPSSVVTLAPVPDSGLRESLCLVQGASMHGLRSVSPGSDSMAGGCGRGGRGVGQGRKVWRSL